MSALGTFFNVSTPRIRLKVHPWAQQTNVNNYQRTVIVINEQLDHNQQMVIHEQWIMSGNWWTAIKNSEQQGVLVENNEAWWLLTPSAYPHYASWRRATWPDSRLPSKHTVPLEVSSHAIHGRPSLGLDLARPVFLKSTPLFLKSLHANWQEL